VNNKLNKPPYITFEMFVKRAKIWTSFSNPHDIFDIGFSIILNYNGNQQNQNKYYNFFVLFCDIITRTSKHYLVLDPPKKFKSQSEYFMYWIMQYCKYFNVPITKKIIKKIKNKYLNAQRSKIKHICVVE
jgi:hypothetical protein